MSFHKSISGREVGVVSLGNDHGVRHSPQMPFALLRSHNFSSEFESHMGHCAHR